MVAVNNQTNPQRPWATVPAAQPRCEDEQPDSGGGPAVAEPPAKEEAEPKKGSKGKAKPAGKPKPPGMLPPYRVLLHNDDVNTFEDVILTVIELTPLKEAEAVQAAVEAHKRGLSLLLVTHRERAELYVEQFKSKLLTVTIEPAE